MFSEHREEWIALIDSREEFANNWAAGDAEELSEEPETTTNSRRYLVWLQTLAFLLGLVELEGRLELALEVRVTLAGGVHELDPALQRFVQALHFEVRRLVVAPERRQV